jgi:hypothetical protein
MGLGGNHVSLFSVALRLGKCPSPHVNFWVWRADVSGMTESWEFCWVWLGSHRKSLSKRLTELLGFRNPAPSHPTLAAGEFFEWKWPMPSKWGVKPEHSGAVSIHQLVWDQRARSTSTTCQSTKRPCRWDFWNYGLYSLGNDLGGLQEVIDNLEWDNVPFFQKGGRGKFRQLYHLQCQGNTWWHFRMDYLLVGMWELRK